MTTVFPKVRAKTAGAGLSPHGKTNNMLSCEMAFDAFPEGKGAQQTSHWGWNHGGKYCSIIINSFFLFLSFFYYWSWQTLWYTTLFTTAKQIQWEFFFDRGWIIELHTGWLISILTDRYFGWLDERPTDRLSLWSHLWQRGLQLGWLARFGSVI